MVEHIERSKSIDETEKGMKLRCTKNGIALREVSMRHFSINRFNLLIKFNVCQGTAVTYYMFTLLP